MTRHVVSLFYFLLLSISCFAQEKIYNYLHFTEKDGLISNEIQGLALDQDGLLWISGKRGLSYFDGIRFVDVNVNQELPLLSNYLGKIAIDQSGKLWITTNSNGLLCYDRSKPLNKAIKEFQARVFDRDLIKNELYDVLASNSGLIYFGGQETDLQVLDPATEKISQISIPGIAPKTYFTVYRLAEDQVGNIWIGTRHHGLIKYNPSTKEIKQLNLNLPIENGASAIAFNNNQVFAGYYNQDMISLHSDMTNLSTSILGWGENVNFYDNYITALAYWPTEKLILGAHNNRGLFHFNPVNNKLNLISWNQLIPEATTSGKINVIIPSNEGYWLGSNLGLFYYSNQINKVSNIIPIKNEDKGPILNIVDWNQKMWYRTAQGFGELSKDYKTRISFYPFKDVVVSTIHAVEDKLYFSTYDRGVFEFSNTTKQFSQLPIIGPTHGFEKADCNSVIFDRVDGNPILWIGSWNSGLYQYDLTHKKIRLFNASNGLPNHKVIVVGKNADQSIWLGMDGYGLVLIKDKNKPIFKQYTQEFHDAGSLASNTILSFYLSKDKRFWFSNGKSGIGEIIKAKNDYHFKQYPDKNPYPWMFPNYLSEDSRGFLWLKTLDGTMVYDSDSKQFYHLIAGKGIYPGAHFKTSSFYLNGHDLIWCTDQGLVFGDLRNLPINKELTIKPLISGLTILHRNQNFRLIAKDLVLKANENNFSFSFSAAEQAMGLPLKFAYFLEGQDEDWVEATSDQQAYYNNLPGGNYIFKVKVGDKYGNWSPHIIDVPFHLNSYWYATPWFKLLVIIILLSSIILFFVFRINQQKQINKMQVSYNTKLEEELTIKVIKIKEQAADIERAKQEKVEKDFKQKLYESELKAIRSQMNPHFIFNVLNSIEAYVVENDSKNASKLIQKFSSLSRIVLENSQFSIVTMKSEIQLVKLYLELEQIRFNKAFDFIFDIEPSVDWESVKVPSMLIQPLVENAVHHGVRHLKNIKGKILIRATLLKNQVYIRIMDNGVGFKNCAKGKNNSFKTTSFGIKGIQERINMINSNYQEPIAYLLFSNDNIEAGFKTQVTIVLPLHTDYHYAE